MKDQSPSDDPPTRSPGADDWRTAIHAGDHDAIATAMRRFIDAGDRERFAQAVALFVHAARERGDPVEQVLGLLESIADSEEGSVRGRATVLHRSELRRLLMRGVLLAFYGVEVVEREADARARRRDRAESGNGF